MSDDAEGGIGVTKENEHGTMCQGLKASKKITSNGSQGKREEQGEVGVGDRAETTITNEHE